MNIFDGGAIHKTIQNRELPIEARVGAMYISAGVLASVIGLVICILVHANIVGILSVLGIAIVASIAMIYGFKRSDLFFVRNAVIVVILILIPVVFIFSGGNTSGCPIWFLYELYFIVLGCSGKILKVSFPIAVVIDGTLMVLDYVGCPFIFHLQSEKDTFISIIGSIVVVSIAILYTVTTYKKLYNQEREELIIQSKELEKANMFEKMFLANMSHELRTPINSIIGFDEMIKRKSEDPLILEYANDIAMSSEHLLTLVNDILDLSKIEAGEIILNERNYCISEGVKMAYDIVRKRIEDKGLKFNVKVDSNIPISLRGDKERVLQIALNMLTNAAKYTEEGSVTLDISTEAIPGDTDYIYLVIAVTDTGMGIAEENLKSIFSAYRRVDREVASIEGTGLGLAITKNYAEIMGGTITVDSELGKGSTFTAKMKQRVIDWNPLGPYDVTKSISKDLEQRIENRPRAVVAEKNATILVVDDTVMNLKVIKSLLEDSGCNIITANSGERAIACVKKCEVDLIFMDIMMPRMSGVQAMNEIRKIKPDIPVVALTANAISGAKEEYLEDGFNDYLSKPVKPSLLDEMLLKYISK